MTYPALERISACWSAMEDYRTPHDGSAAAHKVFAKPVPYVCRTSAGTGRIARWGADSARMTHVVAHTIMIAQEGET
jgi:hypothetical protein